MLDIGKNSERGTPSPELSLAPSADDFYKRDVERKSEDGLLQFLSFIVDDEEYALELGETKEVIKMRDVTEVPHAPSFVAGIISLRGEIIPVVNLSKRLGLKEKEATPEARTLIAFHADIKMGLMVDKIMGVLRIDPDKIEPAPPVQQEAGVEFVRGVAHHQGRLVILLSLPALFRMEEV